MPEIQTRARSSFAKGPVAFLLVVFLASRVLAWYAGVRYDTSLLPWGWHMPDLPWLVQDLWRTVWHWHASPPLFHVLVGGLLLVGGNAALAAFYGLLGLVLTFSIQALLGRVGLAPWPAALLTALFITSPACLLYEQWCFYTYPVTVLLTFGTLMVHDWLATGERRWAWAGFGALAALALTMALFHLFWLLVIAGLAVRLARRLGVAGGRVAIGTSVAIVLGWYLKNLVMFGTFGASSWLGMCLAHTTVFQIPEAQRQAYVREGRLGSLSLTPMFEDLSHYRGLYTARPVTGQVVLDAERKSNGTLNFNHRNYLPVSRAFLGESFKALRVEPLRYLKSVTIGLLLYLRPADDYGFLHPNRWVLRPYPEAWDVVFNGSLAPLYTPPRSRDELRLRWEDLPAFAAVMLSRLAWWLVIAMPLLGVWAWRAGRTGGARGALLHFIVANLLIVLVIGCTIEQGENNRFRFATDPLLLTLFGAWLADKLRDRTRSSADEA